MSTAQDLLNSVLGGAATSDVAPAGSLSPNESVANSTVAPTSPAQPATNTAQRLMDQIPSLAINKQTDVAAKAATKQAQIGGPTTINNISRDQLYSAQVAGLTGNGLKTMPSDIERDVATLPDVDLYLKYGSQAQDLISRRQGADNALLRDQIASRGSAQAVGDFGTGVGLGVMNSVGGIAALGAGLVNQDAGTALATGLKNANDWTQENLQSDSMAAHRRVNQAENELGYRDNKAQEAIDEKTQGSFMAGLNRIGNDAVTAVGNAVSDGTILSDGIAQGLGSLITAGPTGKAVAAVGKAVVPAATRRAIALAGEIDAGVGNASMARALSAIGSKEGTTMIGMGLMEGGGAYQQNAADVAGTSFEDLAKNSPMFNQLVASGMSKDEARTTVANRSGLIAAAIQGPAALVAGKLTAKFEADPFSVNSLRHAGQNILKEGLEETIQSGTGQAAQNVATKATANQNQDLLEGVGEQAGLGGLYGMGAAAHVQAPGAILSTGSKAAKGTYNAAKDAVGPSLSSAAASVFNKATSRADKVAAENAKASPVSNEQSAQDEQDLAQNLDTSSAQAQEAVQAADMPEEAKATTSKYVDDLATSSKFSTDELAGAPEWLHQAVGEPTTRVGMLQNLARYVGDKTQPREQREQALEIFHANLDQLHEMTTSQPAELAGLPADHPAKVFADDIRKLVARFQQTPDAQATQEVQKEAVKSQADITENSTPAEIQNALTVAQTAPHELKEGSAETILKMAAAGKVNLSDSQKASLQVAKAIIDGRKAYVNQLDPSLSPEERKAAREVSFNPGTDDGMTLVDHANRVRSAVLRGDLDTASKALNGLGMFAKSQQNKIGAVNTQITTHGGNANTGNSLFYDAVHPDKSGFSRSKDKFGVTPGSHRSVRFVQQVAAEAHALTEVHNALASAYPQLNVGHIDQIALHPSLADSTPQEVADGWKQGKRTASVKGEESSPKSSDVTTEDKTQAPVSDKSNEAAPAQNAPKPVEKPAETPKVSVSDSNGEEALKPKEAAPAKAEPVKADATLTDEGTTQEVAENTQEVAEPQPVKEGLAAVYPNLHEPKSGNKFVASFKMPKAEISSLAGVESPTDYVSEALSSPEGFRAAQGRGDAARVDSTTAKAYRAYLSFVPGIVDDLNANLAEFVKDKMKGKDASTWRNGKLSSLMEEQPDGSFKYNDHLIESAVIAGLQWMLSANNYGGVVDEKAAAKILGINEDEVTPDHLNQLNDGILRIDAVTSLAQKIQSYWGVQADRTADLTFTRGIPQSMAGELLRVLQAQQVGQDEDGNPRHLVQARDVEVDGRAVEMMEVTKFEGSEPLYRFSDAIERVVAKQPELNHYMGGDRPAVAKTQMRNPQVKNTRQQIQMIQNEQDTVHRINPRMAALYSAIGVDALVDIFGPGQLDETKMNKNDFRSKTGQVLAIRSAFDVFNETMATALSHDQNPENVEIRYGYNMSRVGRLQMLGRFNPQASKLMREVVLPTESTINVSRGDGRRAFMLAMGQAIGEKVHNMPYKQLERITRAKLNGVHAPAIAQLREFQKTGKLDVDELKANFVGDKSFVQLHALMEYARYLEARENDPKALKAFKTQLYLEADGMTNGPVNAMALLSTGSFLTSWIRNMGKGGLWFGGSADQTSTIQRSTKDSLDLYKETANRLQDNLAQMRQNLPDDVAAQQTHLLNLMSLTFGKDLTFDDQTGTISIDRGVAKNPLTITIYGSGKAGIAAKLVSLMVEKLYSDMSAAVAAGRGTDEFYGSDDASKARAKKLMDSLDALQNQQVKVSKTEGIYLESVDTGTNESKGLEDFTFSKAELKAMRQNMQALFVEPLNDAIQDTVGRSTFESANLVQKTTQVQSIVMQHAFAAAVQAKLDAKKKAPGYVKGTFLSQAELDEIEAGMQHLYPFLKSSGQTFYVAGSASSTLMGQDGKNLVPESFGASLDDRFRIPAMIDGPGDAGVAGIPFLNIGMGDGMMMQLISTMPNAIGGTLKIFDGMNMPLDKITEGSQQANKAVLQSWMGNPLKVIADSFTPFVKDAGLDKIKPGSELHIALAKAIFGPFVDMKKAPLNVVTEAIEQLSQQVQYGAESIEARHRVLNRVNLSVDQMAAASSPHLVQNKVQISDNPELAQAQLNSLLEEEMDKIDAKRVEGNQDISKELLSLGTKHASGANVLNFGDISTLADQVKIKIPAAQMNLLRSIQKSLGGQGYKIILGKRSELAAYNESQGSRALDGDLFTSRDTKGFLVAGRKEIYLMSGSSETLVHELIHAATFQTIADHYAGNSTPLVKFAVKNIEQLMEQFRNMDVNGSQKLEEAYQNASNAIEGHLANGNQAAALNEFMAWSLANQDLNRLAERTSSPLVQIARAVVNHIKQLIWGRRDVPKSPGEDMLSNLRFNTQIIMNSQPSVAQAMRDTVLFQNTSYGSDERLQQFDDAFDRKVVDYLRAPQDMLQTSQRQTKVAEALKLGTQVTAKFAAAFPMTMQEKTTFSKIIGALATEAELNPNALVQMQEMWQQVTKALTVEMLEDKNDSDEGRRRYDAQLKYNTVMGDKGTMVDGAGRSTLLPAFMALATTNNQFREVLAEMELPKAKKSDRNSRVDAALEDVANQLLDSLSAKMSGQGQVENVLTAMDNLTSHMAEIAQDRQSYMDQYLQTSGGLMDAGNQYLVDGMNALARFVSGKTGELNAKYNNGATAFLNSSARLVEAVVNEETAGKVAEGVMAAMNRIKGFAPLRELVGDMVGRTDSNANVYDMIKLVRSMIAQYRQQFREVVPKTIADKFTRELETHEWEMLHRGLGRTDLASLAQGMKQDEVMELLRHPAKLKAKISELEDAIKAEDSRNFRTYQQKMQELADYMMSGRTSSNLLRNAFAIGNLFGQTKKRGHKASDALVQNIDMLTSLYALEHMGMTDRIAMSTLADKEAEGMLFTLSYLQGQRVGEQSRASGNEMARANNWKGYIPRIQEAGASLIVADDKEHNDLLARSYTRVAKYEGSSADTDGSSRSYYYAPVSGRNMFSQGILQNVRQTMNGVDVSNGFAVGNYAGRITNADEVAAAAAAIQAGESGTEHLLPVYSEDGSLVAFERSVDPSQVERLNFNQNLHEMIGVWRGRQVEEASAEIYNENLIGHLGEMYDKDMLDSTGNREQYVNVFDPKELARDKVLADAVKLITRDMREQIEQTFGKGTFMVRRDMLNDVMGYRAATVGDAWTGTSRWSPETQNVVKRIAMSIGGNAAYKTMVNYEKTWQNFVGDVKTMIVVKSVVVPMSNIISNGYQLIARGVPVKSIITGMPKKTAEVQFYAKSEVDRIKLDADLRAAEGRDDVVAQRKLKAAIQSIEDAHKRLSIWPLIEAGEFSAISDGQATVEDIELTSGRLHSYIESLVNQLPDEVKTAGRYAIITKDTALFQGMQKAMEYGDFLAKAILYDDITKRKKQSSEYALSRVTEEFVNYDRLPGRFRGYLENMGLLWFYNFKIRSTKVALSMIRNNPLHALMAGLAPAPSGIGTPLGDNLISKVLGGNLGMSMGLGQLFHAPMMNPWVNIAN